MQIWFMDIDLWLYLHPGISRSQHISVWFTFDSLLTLRLGAVTSNSVQLYVCEDTEKSRLQYSYLDSYVHHPPA